ncbi:MAG: DUF11 domain-containing protein [Chloroflexia bacterium]|nr:DUF11 domain-containing protein [Chloroflexia bacterium]
MKALSTVIVLILALAVILPLSAGPLAPKSPQADIVLDGLLDGEYVLLAQDPAGDQDIPGSPDTAWTDLTELYTAEDGSNLYVYVILPGYALSTSSGEIGLALDTSGDVPDSGGEGDPWGRAISYNYRSIYYNAGSTPISTTYTVLPDAVIRGNIPGIGGHPFDDNNGWTELLTWNGTAWTGFGSNWGGLGPGQQIGIHIAYADGQGVELAIPYADLGISPGSTVHLEFYSTQKSMAKGAYDTVPSDDQSAGWDDPTTQFHLASHGSAGPPPTATAGPSPTPTNTPTPTPTPSPGPSPTPTPTPTPGQGPCSGAGPGDGAIVTAEIYHNSRKLAWRDPFGPIPQDGAATLWLQVCQGDVEAVEALVWETGDPLNDPSHTYGAAVSGYDPSGPYDIWEVQVPGPAALVDQWYQFRISDGGYSGYYHVLPDSGNSGPGDWSDSLIDRSWRLGTYLAGFENAGWIEDAVIYQIFPDRFRNGNPANDPVEGTTVYGPHTCDGGPCVVDLHDTWTELPTNPPFGVDFFGGDLEGVVEKLPYLDELGINLIYFNPVFAASSNHGYDANDYYAIRDDFGGDAAFEQLVAAAEPYGIRVILDGCFNHTGSDSRYMDAYGADRWPPPDGACESAGSPFREWYTEGSSGQDVCDGGWGWYGWWGFETIPELQEIDPVKDFIYRGGSPYSPDGVAVSQYWVEQGSAGWRFDVAQDISHDWWAEMRPYVKGHSSQTLMLGEVTAGCMDWSSYLRGDQLDAVMNYCFRDWAISWANGNPPSAFDSAFTAFRAQYPRPAVYSMMNLLDSHDTARALNLLGEDKARLKLAALLQMTLPGAPSVYYGDDVGVSGGRDPDCRRTYPWADQDGSPDLDLLAHYQTVIGIRNAHSALRGGEMETLLVDDGSHLYSFIRWDEGERVVVVLNNGSGSQAAAIPVGDYLEDGSVLTDTLNGGSHSVQAGTLSLDVAGQWGAILVTGAAAPRPDLSNSAKGAPATALAGDTITYTLTLRNSGGAPAAASLTDTLPLSVTVLTASLPAGMSYDGGALRWSGDVAPGAEVSLPFQAVIDPNVPGETQLLNRVEIDDGAGGAWTRQAGTRVLAGPQPDLGGSDKEAPESALAGDTLPYTITLRNGGWVSASVQLTDSLPPSLTVVTASLPAGMAHAGGQLTWSGTVEVGLDVVLGFQAVIDPGAAPDTLLLNVVEINDGAGGVLSRQAGTRVLAGPLPDLGASRKAAPATAPAGQTIPYTITLHNGGLVSAGVRLTDSLPAGLTVVTASLPAGMAHAGGQLTWSGTVEVGLDVVLGFQAVIEAGVAPGTTLLNTVEIDDGAGGRLVRVAGTLVEREEPPYRVYLPSLMRGAPDLHVR